MSFTYQRTHKSIRVDTRPNLHSARALFDSEDEEEDEEPKEHCQRPLALTYLQSREPEAGGDPAWCGRLKCNPIFAKKNF